MEAVIEKREITEPLLLPFSSMEVSFFKERVAKVFLLFSLNLGSAFLSSITLLLRVSFILNNICNILPCSPILRKREILLSQHLQCPQKTHPQRESKIQEVYLAFSFLRDAHTLVIFCLCRLTHE